MKDDTVTPDSPSPAATPQTTDAEMSQGNIVRNITDAPPAVSPDVGKRLTEIEERAAKATPGPWSDDGYRIRDANGEVLTDYKHFEATGADGQFIAHARVDVPWLIAQLREMSGLRDAAEARAAAMREALVETEMYVEHTPDCVLTPGDCICGAEATNQKVAAALSPAAGADLLARLGRAEAEAKGLREALEEMLAEIERHDAHYADFPTHDCGWKFRKVSEQAACALDPAFAAALAPDVRTPLAGREETGE